MLIVCPDCASRRYVSPDALRVQGRKLVCEACRSTWIEHGGLDAIEGEATNAAVALAARPPAPRTRTVPGPRRRWPRPGAGTAVIGLVVVAMALVAQRASIVRIAPQTARLYAAIGLPVNLRGLALANVRSTILEDGGRRVLAVQGDICNLSGAALAAPDLMLSVIGARGEDIYVWTAGPPKAKFAADESAPFRARLVAPPSEAREVLVRFVDAPPVKRASRADP